MLTKAPGVRSGGPPTQQQIDEFNAFARNRGFPEIRRFVAGTRYRDAAKAIAKVRELPLLPDADETAEVRGPSERQIPYLLSLQEQVGEPVGIPDDMTFWQAKREIDRLKSKRGASS